MLNSFVRNPLTFVLIVLFSLLMYSTTALSTNVVESDLSDDWGDDSWGEEIEESPWQFSGFVEAAYGQFTQSQNALSSTTKHSNTPLREVRARINLNYSTQHFDITAKGEVLFDHVPQNKQQSNTQIYIRELNIKASPFNFLDIKIGKQVLTWGTADYLFMNDLFPKDWQSFFSGRDDEYLKAPSTSFKTSWYFSDYTLDVVWTPEFSEDNFIRGERFSFYSPFLQQQIKPNTFEYQQSNDEQWFTRLSTTQQGVEYALYGYKGRWTTPEGLNTNESLYFPKMNAMGASIRTSLFNGIFNAEVVNYNSIESTHGYSATNFAPNSQQRILLGYETELIKNVTLNTQYYLEHTKNYQEIISSYPFPEKLKDKNRQLITVRLSVSALQQKLLYSLFTFYSPTDNDGYLKTSLRYRQNDNWLYSIGANLFWGKEEFSFFGQHQINSNVWGRVKYQF